MYNAACLESKKEMSVNMLFISTDEQRVPLEGAIPTPSELALGTLKYFGENKEHTANVLAGPKRENWFSSETFTALCFAGRPLDDKPFLTDFSCWCEQQYVSVFEKVQAELDKSTEGRLNRSDIVCYLPQNGEEAIDAILEIKLLLNDEDSTPVLSKLKEQLLNARRIAPESKVLGFVFVAHAPSPTPAPLERSLGTRKSEVQSVLPASEGFSWLPGYDFAKVFQFVYTGFHYPSITASLALGVLEMPTSSSR